MVVIAAFEGVAETYEAARHGYPVALRAKLTELGVLSDRSFVVDLGAGTGQLVRLVAGVAAEVVAVEPEIDMLRVGRRVTAGLSNVRWIHGRDAELRQYFERDQIDLVVVGNAFHHMSQSQLLTDLDDLVRPGGGVCIATSSVPVWLQDSDWSAALRSVIEAEYGPRDASGVPDFAATVAVLQDSAFSEVVRWSDQQQTVRRCERVVGEIVTSASGQIGPEMLQRLSEAIEPFSQDGQLPEMVRSTAAIGFRQNRS